MKNQKTKIYQKLKSNLYYGTKKHIYSLAIILTIAAFFRFYNLSDWGLIIYDEGQYISETLYTNYSLGWFYNLSLKLMNSSQRAKEINEAVANFSPPGSAVRTARPLHNLTLSGPLKLLPHDPSAGKYMIAFFSLISIILTYILSYLLFRSFDISLLSAIILSILPTHIFYSRINMAENNSLVIFILSLIAFYFYIKKNNNYLIILIGFLTGLAFLTNGNRFAFFSIILIQLVYDYKKIPLFIFLHLPIFLITITIAEIPYYLAFLFTDGYNNPTYIEQLLWLYTRLFTYGYNFNITSLYNYVYIISDLNGTLFTFFSILGIYLTLKIRDKNLYIILIPTITTLIFQSLHSLKAFRGISPIIPLMVIFCSYAISLLLKTSSRKYFTKSSLIILVIFFFVEIFMNALNLLDYKSSLKSAIDLLKTFNPQTIITTNDKAIELFLPSVKTINYQNTIALNKLPKFPEKTFVLTTIQKFTIDTKALNLSHKLNYLTESIEKSCQPLFNQPEFQNIFFVKFFAYEHNTDIEKTKNFIKKFDMAKDSNIKIYDYAACAGKIKLPPK